MQHFLESATVTLFNVRIISEVNENALCATFHHEFQGKQREEILIYTLTKSLLFASNCSYRLHRPLPPPPWPPEAERRVDSPVIQH